MDPSSSQELTPNRNTILHVAALFRKSESVAKNDENPPHIAVREQHYDIVEALINGAEEIDQDSESGGGTLRQMLMAANVDGDTPLHLAVREGDNEFVILAVNKYKACQRPNNAHETPSFLAEETASALHGAATSRNIAMPLEYGLDNPNIGTGLLTSLDSLSERMKKLLDRDTNKIYMADAQSWKLHELHDAADCGDKKAVKELLDRNKSLAYIHATGKHDNGIALHIAVAKGHDDVMEEILSHCPDSLEMVNGKGQNILHIALDRKAITVIHYLIKKGKWASLENQNDKEGNTPLRLLDSPDMKDTKDFIKKCRAEMSAVNNTNETLCDVGVLIEENSESSWFSRACCWRNKSSNEERKAKTTRVEPEKKEGEDKAEAKNTTVQIHMLVATLIATITFAAGFTVPGGYALDGKAVLVGEASFKAFVITNTIAVMCSTSSVLLYAIGTLYNDDNKKAMWYIHAFGLVIIAIFAMTGSFLSGTYAILGHSHDIKIATFFTIGIWLLIYLSGPIWSFIVYILSCRGNN